MPLDRDHTPLEPFDVTTPRLTYEEVRVLVGDLPDAALAELAAGPIEVDTDGKLCGVCSTLRPYARRGRRGEEPEEVRAAAELLICWHDGLNPGGALQRELGYGSAFGVSADVDDQVHGLLGATAHARCCTIYALATVEMIERIAAIARPKGSNA
jgi:hypothetical protein